MAFFSFLVAWLAPSPEWYYAAFALWGLSTGGLLVSGMLVVLELASPAQRPTYVGLTNSALGFASALAPLIGGWLAGYGYSWVFAMSAGVTLLSLIMLRWRVREPRWHTPT
jgi:MFS family permease